MACCFVMVAQPNSFPRVAGLGSSTSRVHADWPTCDGSRRSAGTTQRALCQESLMRCPERLTPGRRSAVHGGVNQYLLDLIDRYAGSERTLHIDAQLVGPTQRRQDRKIQHAPRLAIQTWPGPGVPPRPLGHDALKGHHELVGVSEICIDVLSTQDIPTRLKALLEQFALVHGARLLSGCRPAPMRG